MMSHAEALQPPRSGLLSFLREELAPRPGRVAAAARIAGSCTVVVALAMLYQIPLPAYMAYVVFLISRDEAASTLLTGVVGGVAVTLAVLLSLLFYTLDASEPALRLPLIAGSAFVAMFLARTMALGPVAFLAGFVLVLSQTLIDEIPTLEGLTRLILWLSLVAVIPAGLTVLVNLAVGEPPRRLAHRTALRLLGVLTASLRQGDAAPLQRHQAEAIALVDLRHRAGMLDRDLRRRDAIDTALIETLAELLTLARMLPADTEIDARLQLAKACEASATAFERGEAPTMTRPDETVLATLSATARPVVVAIADALARLADGIAQRRTAIDRAAAPSAKAMFVPDAFSNPAHARFALKTTAAVMAAYAIYSGLDWPGISTSITTCFFVALGSLGETVHKLTLRLTGAVIGGLIGGLCIVFVLPGMTDIGQLCLLIAAVSIPCAWVATSSDRLAYAGMQAAFAFFLGVLQGYGPATDLTVLRDRVVGILLGNLLISLAFSVLWPTSAVDRARAALAMALRTLGQILTGDASPKAGRRIAVVQALVEASRFAAIATFELDMLPTPSPQGGTDGWSATSLDRLAGAVFVVVDQDSAPGLAAPLRTQDEAISAWFLDSASRLSAGVAAGAPPADPSGLGSLLATLPADAPAVARATIEARLLLQSEIEHAVAPVA